MVKISGSDATSILIILAAYKSFNDIGKRNANSDELVVYEFMESETNRLMEVLSESKKFQKKSKLA